MGKISMKTTTTAGRSAGAVEKSVCCFVYKVKVTDDWWLTHSPLGVTSEKLRTVDILPVYISPVYMME